MWVSLTVSVFAAELHVLGISANSCKMCVCVCTWDGNTEELMAGVVKISLLYLAGLAS